MPSLKEDLENVEIEEADMDEEDRLRKIEESMYWLNRKIKAIAEYVDKEEKATPEEEELWDCGYSEGYEDGVNHAKEAAKETREEEPTEERTSSEYAKGYKDGIDTLAEMLRDEKIDQAMANKKEWIDAMEKVLSIKIPQFPDLATIMSQTQPGGKNEKTEGEPEEKGIDSAKSTKNRVLGLGRKIGDV